MKALQLGADVGLGRIIEQTGDETPDHVFQELAAGRMQLWTISEDGQPVASMITQIEQRPATRAVVVRYLAGDNMPEWAGVASEALKDFARKTECDAVEAIGREGLRKHLLALGWSKVAVLYRMSTDG